MTSSIKSTQATPTDALAIRKSRKKSGGGCLEIRATLDGALNVVVNSAQIPKLLCVSSRAILDPRISQSLKRKSFVEPQ